MSEKDKLVFKALEDGTFKYAQQLVAKQLKKNPNSSYYQALNCYVSLSMGKESEALKNGLDLAKKTPSDPKALELLSSIFRECGLNDEASSVYEKAATKYPNVELISSWFSINLENLDIRGVQKALMSYKKYKNDRNTNLWAAFACFLTANLPDSSRMEKTLFPNLGVKIMESLMPLKNAQEIYIYTKLLEKTAKYQQAADIITGFYKNSKIDLELQILLLKLLEQAENWTQLHETCVKILVSEKTDDFNVWCLFIKTSSNLNKLPRCLDILDSYEESRNSLLAHLEVATYDESAPLEKYLAAYLDKFMTKACCFLDLKQYVDKIDKIWFLKFWEQKLEPMDNVTLNQLTLRVNWMKFRCLFDAGILDQEEFFDENIRYYNASKSLLRNKDKTDYFVGDEFILISVLHLLRRYVSSNDLTFILEAILLLENAVNRDVHEFRLRLWLMKLYNFINCSSISKINFSLLGIKQIQIDTLSYHVSSRMSSINPYNVADLKEFQKFYVRGDKEIIHNLRDGFNNGAYNKIAGFIEFADRIKNSVQRSVYSLEFLRMGRLTNERNLINYGHSLSSFIDIANGSDNRDFKTHWKFGSHEIDESLHSSISIPVQDSNWVKMMYLREQLLTETNSEKMKTLASKLEKLFEEKTSSLTEIEQSSIKIVLSLSKAYLDKEEQEFDSLTQLYSNISSNYQLSVWTLNHVHLTYFDISKATTSFITNHNFVKKHSKLVNGIKTLNTDLYSQTREKVMGLKRENLEHINSYEAKLKQFGKKYEISEDLIDNVLDNIKSSQDESIAVLRRF